MLRFSSDEGLFSSYGGLFATFFYVGTFLLRLPPGVGPFSQCKGFFCYYFLHVGGLFCLHGGFYVFMGFLWACPFPLQFILLAHAIM